MFVFTTSPTAGAMNGKNAYLRLVNIQYVTLSIKHSNLNHAAYDTDDAICDTFMCTST